MMDGKFISGMVLAALLAIFTCPAVGRCDIFRYVDANGVVHFTDTPTTTRYTVYMKENGSRISVSDSIRHCAALYRLEDALVRAVIKVESNYDPTAVSRKGALGLMQLMPETARDMNVKDPMNAGENIRGGSRYLRLMLDHFDDNLDLALAAYNAGPGAVSRHGGIPPYKETRNYVERVKKYLRFYRQNKDIYL